MRVLHRYIVHWERPDTKTSNEQLDALKKKYWGGGYYYMEVPIDRITLSGFTPIYARTEDSVRKRWKSAFPGDRILLIE